MELPYDPAAPLLGIYPEETIIEKGTYTPAFTAATIHSSARRQPGYLSTEEWIKKLWYIYIMEYYSAIKKTEVWSFVEMWMDLSLSYRVK